MNKFDKNDDDELQRMLGEIGWVVVTLAAIASVAVFFANHFRLINVIGG